MTIFHALILGMVQGLAEMLPVSSSAHLILLPWFFKFPDPGLAFDVALHVGTLIALLVYFWQDWLDLLKAFWEMLKTRKIKTFNQKLVLFLLIASIPGAIFGYLFDSAAESTLRNPLLIAFTLTVFGLILLFVDRADKGERNLKNMQTKDPVWIGLAQALAIIPGVSRSGATMTTGLFLGFDRESVAKFSFLMAAPIIAGAGLVKIKDLGMHEIVSLPFWVAILSAVIFSWLAIKFVLNYVKKHNFAIFAYYRFVLAALIVIVYLNRR